MTGMLKYIQAAAVAFALTATAAQAEKFSCGSERGFSPYDVQTLSGFDHRRFGPIEQDMFKEFGMYVASFDGADDDVGDTQADYLAVPHWVAYQLNGLTAIDGKYEEPDISIGRPSDWYKSPEFVFLWEEQSAVKRKRIDNSFDGIGSIWNRGHLAMADHAQRYAQTSTAELEADKATEVSWQASCNTHVYWNAVPQAANMNQGPWLHLENYTAALSNKYGKVWIIAGPIFYPDQDILYIGDPAEIPVAVPHALFKVILLEIDGAIDVRAFVFEQDAEIGSDGNPRPVNMNEWVKCSSAKSRDHFYDHTQRMRSLAEVEDLTGLSIAATDASLTALRDREFDRLWEVEEAYWSGFICGGQTLVNKPAS